MGNEKETGGGLCAGWVSQRQEHGFLSRRRDQKTEKLVGIKYLSLTVFAEEFNVMA